MPGICISPILLPSRSIGVVGFLCLLEGKSDIYMQNKGVQGIKGLIDAGVAGNRIRYFQLQLSCECGVPSYSEFIGL